MVMTCIFSTLNKVAVFLAKSFCPLLAFSLATGVATSAGMPAYVNSLGFCEK